MEAAKDHENEIKSWGGVGEKSPLREVEVRPDEPQISASEASPFFSDLKGEERRQK